MYEDGENGEAAGATKAARQTDLSRQWRGTMKIGWNGEKQEMP